MNSIDHTGIHDHRNIRYSKAFDENMWIVDIDDIKNEKTRKDQEFTCIGCGKRLHPRTGQIRIAHFCHYKSDACAFETYLHKLGKEMFRKEFERRKREFLSFILRIPEKVICNKYERFGRICSSLSRESKHIDLVIQFPEIQVETKVDEFIPDILIFNPQNETRVFIEIVVSNAPSQEKRDSGYPIIQINATCEDDFNFLIHGVISESISNVEIHNFPEDQVTISECCSTCEIDDMQKHYFDSLDWIKRSFEYCKTHSLPFHLEYLRGFSCSRYKTQFETECHYQESSLVDLILHYESAEIISINRSAYLKLIHRLDSNRDILFSGKSNQALSGWKGGIIEIIESEMQIVNKDEYLHSISHQMVEFNLLHLRRNKSEKDCAGNCKQTHQFFCIKKDMGAMMPEFTLSDKRLHDNSFPFIRLLDSSIDTKNKEEMFFRMVASSLEEGIPVNNCYVCRYHELNNSNYAEDSAPIFCKTFKKSCPSNEAVNCERYRPDLSSVSVNERGRGNRFFPSGYSNRPFRKWNY